MPRNTDPNQLQFDPEIERTARQLRKEAKSRHKSDTSKPRSEEFTEEHPLDESINNPADRINPMANPERTLRGLAAPDVTQQPLCIGNPAQNTNFELKSRLIHLLPTFEG